MDKNKLKKAFVAFIAAVGIFIFALPATAATITIVNNDSAGEGFNDPTGVVPVPGNPATTLGGQRLNAAQAAANAWGAVLTSPVTIVVRANFDPLSCNATSAVLGQAGSTGAWRDFAGAPRANTWYDQALADSLAGTDLDPGVPDIDATFNSSVDFNNNCLNNTDWWYGIGSPAPAGTIDFFKVLLHEMGHGLGFHTWVDITTGAKALGYDDAYMVNLEDHSLELMWPAMSNGQRAASAIDTNDLHWTGSNVTGNSSVLSGGVHPSGHVQMYAPSPVELGSSVAHWDTAVTPNELMEPFATPDAEDLETYQLFRDIGWTISGSVTGGTPPPPPYDDTLLTSYMPAILAAVKAGKPPVVNPRWGVLNYVCCPSSSATYTATTGSQSKSSTLASCSSEPTFNGYVYSTPGIHSFSHLLSSSGCGDISGSGSLGFQGGKEYLLVLELLDGVPTVVVYFGDIPSSLINPLVNGLSGDHQLTGFTRIQSIPMSVKQDADGQSNFQDSLLPRTLR